MKAEAKRERRITRMARRGLWRKEWREERPALIAGVVIYCGLPILWSLLYSVFDRKHEMLPGLATGLLLLSGWLFAAVVAAQCVARDLGGRRGEFLFAQPVTPRQVIAAKISASFGLVLLIALLVTAIEAALKLVEIIVSKDVSLTIAKAIVF